MKLPRILIAAPKSGTGKTLVTCGLLQALMQRGNHPAAFKCGPDYIDPLFHREVLGVPGCNLDSFLCPETTVRELLAWHGRDCGVAVLEGVMGFYDGLGGVLDDASAYDISRITRTPVVLVVDGRGASLSLAPLIRGFREYREDSRIQGVILNRISPGMYQTLKDLIERECGVRVYGYVPVLEDGALESRHLGLKLPWEAPDLPARLKRIADRLEETLDLDGLVELAGEAPELDESQSNALESAKLRRDMSEFTKPQKLSSEPETATASAERPLRIGVALDEAFCFTYPDNLRFLEERGAQIVPFSPLHDERLPEKLDGLVFYGGYPELHGKELARQEGMRRDIRQALEDGLPCMAECGGFQYLMERMRTKEGEVFPMVGFLPGESFPATRKRFGYVTLEGGTVFGREAGKIRAHEYHAYDSDLCGEAFRAVKPVSGRSWSCMVSTETLLAGYPHLHYYGNPAVGEAFLAACRKGERT